MADGFQNRRQRQQHGADLRDAALQAMQPEDIAAVVEVLVGKAKGGDLPAIRALSGLLGRYKETQLFDTAPPVVDHAAEAAKLARREAGNRQFEEYRARREAEMAAERAAAEQAAG